MTDHLITPPPELVEQWWEDTQKEKPERWVSSIATQAARWGADQELEACISVILYHPGFGHPELFVEVLRAARRPKPMSLKEQALKELHHLVERLPEGTLFSDAAILRAIESLPD